MDPLLMLSLLGLISSPLPFSSGASGGTPGCPEPVAARSLIVRPDWTRSIDTTICSHPSLNVKCPPKGADWALEPPALPFPPSMPPDTLPIVSLEADPDDFFSPGRGIYVPGRERPKRGHSKGLVSIGNYYRKGPLASRSALVRYSDARRKMCFSDRAEVRIHGEDSRASPQKSLRLALSKHAFPLGDSVGRGTRKFVLYQPFLSLGGFKLNHFLASRLLRDFAYPVQDFYPVSVYLNGEYWGIHLLSPKEDPDNLPFRPLGKRIVQSETGLLAFYERSAILGCRKDCVALVERHLEVDSYLRFVAFQYFIGNEDYHDNYKFAATPAGKQLFLYYDLDEIFVPDLPLSRFLQDPLFLPLRILLEEPAYREQFVREVHAWQERISGRKALALLDDLLGSLAPELVRHDRRWGHPLSDGALLANVSKIQRFFEGRDDFLKKDLQPR